MTRARTRQAGLSLLELLVALPLAVVLLAPLAQMIHGALQLQRAAAEQHDVAWQARFAMQRMVAAVRATAPRPLMPQPSGTTGDWLGPVAFCLNGAAQLIETTPADTGCTGVRVVGERVTAFAVQTFNAGARAATVIEISLTATSPSGQNVPLTARTRLGGGLL